MKYLLSLVLLLGMSFSSPAVASDVTKVDLKGKQAKKYYRLNIDNDRAVLLRGPIREHVIKPIIQDMKDMAELGASPIYLIINSPGGSVVDGFELINVIRTLKAEKKVLTYCAIESEAFSMAALIAMYCHRTYAHKYSSIMFHQVSYGVQGLASFISSRVHYMENYVEMLEMDIANQLGISLEDYRLRSNSEWWMTSEQAAKFGFVDGLLNHLYYNVPEEAAPPPFFFGLEHNGDVVQNPLKHGEDNGRNKN